MDETFSTAAPISLYGATKLASEALALEYGETFGFPVWINRCGVLAGAGQFGRPDQGILAYWINAYLRRQPLKYIGFGGRAIRCATPCTRATSCRTVVRQMENGAPGAAGSVNLGGRRGERVFAGGA